MTDSASGLRGAIPDLLVPEFSALRAEDRGLNERVDPRGQ